jgi:hypothetical protein
MTGDAAGLRRILARRRVASDCNHGNGLAGQINGTIGHARLVGHEELNFHV